MSRWTWSPYSDLYAVEFADEIRPYWCEVGSGRLSRRAVLR